MGSAEQRSGRRGWGGDVGGGGGGGGEGTAAAEPGDRRAEHAREQLADGKAGVRRRGSHPSAGRGRAVADLSSSDRVPSHQPWPPPACLARSRTARHPPAASVHEGLPACHWRHAGIRTLNGRNPGTQAPGHCKHRSPAGAVSTPLCSARHRHSERAQRLHAHVDAASRTRSDDPALRVQPQRPRGRASRHHLSAARVLPARRTQPWARRPPTLGCSPTTADGDQLAATSLLVRARPPLAR